jgi:hypothetical protein
MYTKSMTAIAPMGLIPSIFQFFKTDWADDYKEKVEMLDLKLESLK